MQKNRIIPFGYCITNGEYALNITEAEAVKKIFTDYISGKSLKEIAELIEIPYCGNKFWNKNMVCRVIENQRYTGEKGFPQIIEKSAYRQAQEIKQSRCTYKKSAKIDDEKPLEIAEYTYSPTEEIMRSTNEINRLLDTPSADDDEIRSLIMRCAELKYKQITAR